MPQDRDSGDRARKWGYDMAQKVANYLGATLINPGRSNEAIWNNRRILIKSAHYGVPQIGATPATLDLVEAIIAALQDKDKAYTLYEVTPSWFRPRMNPSRSLKASHVMMVRCAEVRGAGKMLGRIQNPLGGMKLGMERRTVRRIHEAVREGIIPAEFTPAQVNTALGINWAGTFLPKHRVGNPGGNTELFTQIGRGLYKLKTITGG